MPVPPLDTPCRWAIYCRVVDNFGDVGVCWRLAADLGARGHAVRLVIDDARALAWLAPDGAPGVTVVPWPGSEGDERVDTEQAVVRDPTRDVTPNPTRDRGAEAAIDVVIEAFGCALPSAVRATIVAAATPPVWINLEYLSAERFAEDAHGLASPQFDTDGRRIDKWFFYPGFSARSGGLIREVDLMARRAAFDCDDWFASMGIAPLPDERVVSLFCYENRALDALLTALCATPTLLLATAGSATAQVERALGASMQRGALRAVPLRLLTQRDYDHLLWSCDINFVRGEDSFVRAQWAGAPFVWQAYPQHDGVHADKVDAFLDAMGAAADARDLFEVWNGSVADGLPSIRWPDESGWRGAAASWQRSLAAQSDLATRLIGFVAGKR